MTFEEKKELLKDIIGLICILGIVAGITILAVGLGVQP